MQRQHIRVLIRMFSASHSSKKEDWNNKLGPTADTWRAFKLHGSHSSSELHSRGSLCDSTFGGRHNLGSRVSRGRPRRVWFYYSPTIVIPTCSICCLLVHVPSRLCFNSSQRHCATSQVDIRSPLSLFPFPFRVALSIDAQ